ncbi:MAG: DUF1700 domain-containing protein [Anaeroplasmataceae bacterium]|nr:DUF1700 domain-containing protein [Anaeroplasmataceae bacterium]
MRKREFMKRLGEELSHLDRDERDDILDYYDELIEDRIERTGKSEADVIYDLGEIEDIARRVDPSRKRKFRYEEEEESEDRRYRSRDSREREPVEREEPKSERKRVRRKNSDTKTGVGLVLLICLFPFWIALFAILFGCIAAIVGAGIGCFAGGVLSIWHGCTLFVTSWAQALFRIGIGITLIGVILIVGPLLLKIVIFIGHLIISFFKWLFGGRRETVYED